MRSKTENRKSKLCFAVFIALAIIAFTMTTPVNAQSPNLDDEVNRIAKGLYCPVCPNTPLDVCNTQACADWRADIKKMLQEGKNEQQIRDAFVARFGPQVLGAPPAEGFNWLAYVMIPVAILLGAGIVWFTMQTWIVKRAPGNAPASTPEIPKEYAERIEKELKEL